MGVEQLRLKPALLGDAGTKDRGCGILCHSASPSIIVYYFSIHEILLFDQLLDASSKLDTQEQHRKKMPKTKQSAEGCNRE